MQGKYSNNKPIICEVCGASVKFSKLLKIHIFEKHKPKETTCPICMEELLSREQALEHVKLKHTAAGAPSQQRNAVCDLCGYVGTKGNLTVHIKRVHSGLPTTCTYCGKEFPKHDTMTKHRKMAHPEEWKIDRERLMTEEGKAGLGKTERKIYPSGMRQTCGICGVTLSNRQMLHSHMKSRHGTGLPGYGLHRGKRGQSF